MTMSAKEITSAFKKVDIEPAHNYVQYENGKLHYVTIGDSTLTPLLLIHGSPGSWDAFIDLVIEKKLTDEFFIIIPDRPGYNKTTLSSGLSLQDQSIFLGPLISKYFQEMGIVLGHSYGGAVALQTAVYFEDRVKGVVLAAGTVASPYQSPKWYNLIVHYTPLKWLISNKLLASNQEMYQLADNLLIMEEGLPKFSKPVAIIQGEKDVLVNYKSADYIEGKLTLSQTSKFMRSDMNHFVIWSDKDLILEAINWVVQN